MAACHERLHSPKIEKDHNLGVSTVFLGVGVEARSIENSEFWLVLGQLERIQFPDEHVTGKEIMPGLLGDHSNGKPILWVCTHVTVLDIQIFTLEVGKDASPQWFVALRAERPIDLTPVNLVLTGWLPNQVLVVRGAARVLSGPNHEWSEVGHESLVPLKGVFIESGTR